MGRDQTLFGETVGIMKKYTKVCARCGIVKRNGKDGEFRWQQKKGCHNPSESRVCKQCQSKEQVEHKKRVVSDGLCRNCHTQPQFEGLSKCFRCQMKERAVAAGLPRSCGAQLIDIWNAQGGRCALSGLELSLGRGGAEIDHIYPRALYPQLAGDIRNVRFVHPALNRAKGSLDDHELISICMAVAAKQAAKWELIQISGGILPVYALEMYLGHDNQTPAFQNVE